MSTISFVDKVSVAVGVVINVGVEAVVAVMFVEDVVDKVDVASVVAVTFVEVVVDKVDVA